MHLHLQILPLQQQKMHLSFPLIFFDILSPLCSSIEAPDLSDAPYLSDALELSDHSDSDVKSSKGAKYKYPPSSWIEHSQDKLAVLTREPRIW